MTRKREAWRLPKTTKRETLPDGGVSIRDGEPRMHRLTKWDNDETLRTDVFISCCGCGLTHHNTYNVVKTPNGDWWLNLRSYAIPNTGKDASDA